MIKLVGAGAVGLIAGMVAMGAWVMWAMNDPDRGQIV